jgi:hypothetical protein
MRRMRRRESGKRRRPKKEKKEVKSKMPGKMKYANRNKDETKSRGGNQSTAEQMIYAPASVDATKGKRTGKSENKKDRIVCAVIREEGN